MSKHTAFVLNVEKIVLADLSLRIIPMTTAAKWQSVVTERVALPLIPSNLHLALAFMLSLDLRKALPRFQVALSVGSLIMGPASMSVNWRQPGLHSLVEVKHG